MTTAERTFEGMKTLRDQLVRSGAAVDPGTLVKGDPFYVIGFGVSDGVTLRLSGTFIGREVAGSTTYVTVHLDGEAEPQRLSTAQAGFFPPGSSMVVTVKRLDEFALRTGANFTIDTDKRSDEARAAEIARTPCPCGAVHGDGTKCPDWPDCVIP